MYLWSPRPFEGDQWIEFDLRLESPAGLALVTACASGMQREDFIADLGVPKTGAMATILRDARNYHWEFIRRVEAMRTDVETHYVSKNPFGHKLHCACVPRTGIKRRCATIISRSTSLPVLPRRRPADSPARAGARTSPRGPACYLLPTVPA